MLLLRACPRCLTGDLSVEHVRGVYVATCLHCGHCEALRRVYPARDRTPKAPTRDKAAVA